MVVMCGGLASRLHEPKFRDAYCVFDLDHTIPRAENELIRHASHARPLPAGHAWRVVEVRTNTLPHTSYVSRSSSCNPPAVDGVAVWCCSYHADDAGHGRLRNKEGARHVRKCESGEPCRTNKSTRRVGVVQPVGSVAEATMGGRQSGRWRDARSVRREGTDVAKKNVVTKRPRLPDFDQGRQDVAKCACVGRGTLPEGRSSHRRKHGRPS